MAFFKTGVVAPVSHMHARIQILIRHDGVLDQVAREVWGMVGARITSILDGTHKRTSSHYEGRAVDLGVKPYIPGKGFNHVEFFDDGLRQRAVLLIRQKIDAHPQLGPSSDWYLEDEGDHIHIQIRRGVE